MSMSNQNSNLAMPEEVRAEVEALRNVVEQADLGRKTRIDVITAVRRALLPRRPRKPDPRIDAAYADYRAGIRGLGLFRRHIPNHSTKAHYRRAADERRLMNSIHKRMSRERKAAMNKDRSRGQSSPVNADELSYLIRQPDVQDEGPVTRIPCQNGLDEADPRAGASAKGSSGPVYS